MWENRDSFQIGPFLLVHTHSTVLYYFLNIFKIFLTNINEYFKQYIYISMRPVIPVFS